MDDVNPVSARFFVLLPAMLVGLEIYTSQAAEARREAATRHPVDAVLLTSTGYRAHPWRSPDPAAAGPHAWIAWTDRRSVRHTAATTVRQNLKAGTHVTVWIEQAWCRRPEANRA